MRQRWADARVPVAPEKRRVKSVLVAEVDGRHLRYLKESGDDPVWSPDGSFVYSCDPRGEDG